MILFPEAKDEMRREKILTSPVFAGPLKELETYRQEYLSTPIPELPFSIYKRFFDDGDRTEFEDLYFGRRGRLPLLTVAVLLYHRPEDIRALEDAIWAVCNEFTWVLPAHMKDLGDRYDLNVIDLFSAETGFALAEIYHLLGDVLNPRVVSRILDCLEERIFKVYLNHNFHWEENTANWAAVCSGSVGAAFIYAAPERFTLVKQRLLHSMDQFLKGFGEDGVCVEGVSYWNYGFGFFTYFAQLLLEFTDGEENLFAKPICAKVAAFQQDAYMRKNFTISFSDGAREGRFRAGLTHRLHKIYGTELLDMQYAEYAEYCHRFATYLRNFFWVEPEAARAALQGGKAAREKYYPSAKWYLVNNDSLSLAAKGGHNDEPHNHNDVGSFILVDDEGQILCDYGAGEYTREYFRPETRYQYLCNSSLGHSVPIVDGKAQEPGADHAGIVLNCSDGSFQVDMAGAYSVAELSLAVRVITLEAQGLLLKDSFRFEGDTRPVTERFVTMREPKVKNGQVILGDYRLVCEQGVEPEITVQRMTGHRIQKDALYLIDYNLAGGTEFTLHVEK